MRESFHYWFPSLARWLERHQYVSEGWRAVHIQNTRVEYHGPHIRLPLSRRVHKQAESRSPRVA